MAIERKLPAEVADAIAAMGPAFDPEVLKLSVALFDPIADKSLPPGGQCARNVSYGPHERQAVDIYSPGRSNAPVVVFIPGGGFVRGDKTSYEAVGAALARLGVVGVVANYRLAPDFLWPSGAEDVAAIVDFVAGGIAAYGGQPDQIVMIGQSAGASHVAAAMFDERMRPQGLEAVRHIALMSGLYFLHPGDMSPGALSYFGADAILHADRAPCRTVGGSEATVTLTISEFDPLVYVRQGAQLAVALAEARKRAPEFSTVLQHNHISSILNIATPYDSVSRRLLGPAAARR
ncbi:MAG: alpha/beta hydrolase [Burkholderiaceae bacterium]